MGGNPPFERAAFWAYRPLHKTCTYFGNCNMDTGVFNYTKTAAEYEADAKGKGWAAFVSNCTCGKGTFVTWDTDWSLYVTLVIGVFYSTATAMLVKNFSSVYRSIADALGLLVVYFVADPICHQGYPNDAARDLTSLIVPLSSQTFSKAAAELKKVK